jgi:hypothetical protein
MRDLRDPLSLGDLYLEMRGLGVSIERAVTLPAEKYQNGQFISCDPADHHSRVDQRMNWQEGADVKE